MALVQQPNTIYIDLIDSGMNKSRLQFKTSGFDLVAGVSLMQSTVDDFILLTDCKVMGYGLKHGWKENDEGGATVKCEVEERAHISLGLVQTTPPDPGQSSWGQFIIPGVKEALRLGAKGTAEYNDINVANANLVAFATLFTAGLGILPSLTLSDNQTAEDPSDPSKIKGWVGHRRNRKG